MSINEQLLIRLPPSIVINLDQLRLNLRKRGNVQSRSFIIETAIRVFLNYNHDTLFNLFIEGDSINDKI